MADLLGTTSGIGTLPYQMPPGGNPMEDVLRGTPGWQWGFNQGQRMALGSNVSQTLKARPRTLSALGQYGIGTADQLYGNMVNRYLSLADLGLRGAIAPFA